MIEILVLDGNQTEGKLLRFLLQDLKMEDVFSIHQFRQAQALKDHLNGRQTFENCFLLTETALPGGSGLWLIGELKEHPAWKDIPVVVYTLSTWPGKVKEAYDAGADIVLGKKAELDETLEQFRGFLSHMRVQMTLAANRKAVARKE